MTLLRRSLRELLGWDGARGLGAPPNPTGGQLLRGWPVHEEETFAFDFAKGQRGRRVKENMGVGSCFKTPKADCGFRH